MTSLGRLREAIEDKLNHLLAFASSFSHRKRRIWRANLRVGLTADRLIEHLASSGFVVMKSHRWRLLRPTISQTRV